MYCVKCIPFIVQVIIVESGQAFEKEHANEMSPCGSNARQDDRPPTKSDHPALLCVGCNVDLSMRCVDINNDGSDYVSNSHVTKLPDNTEVRPFTWQIDVKTECYSISQNVQVSVLRLLCQVL